MSVVILIELLIAVAVSFPDATLLSDDSFATREAATARLIRRGPLAVPALALAAHSDDLETRWRAGRAMQPYRTVWLHGSVRIAGAWLFFGPDQADPFPSWHRRRLNAATAAWVKRQSPEWRLALAQVAREWGLLRQGEFAFHEMDSQQANEPGLAVAFVNEMRRRTRK